MLSDGPQIKRCYWTNTKAKKQFIDFGRKIEFEANIAELVV